MRRSSSTSPAVPYPPQHVESVAMELENHCPICLDNWEEASFVLPCLHQFCYPCIVRWAEGKHECPLCKTTVSSILHSVRADDDFEEHIIPPPAAPPLARVTGGAPGHPAAQGLHQPTTLRPPAAGPRPMAAVGSFYTCVWASIFRIYPAVLRPLLPWLQQELGQLLEDAQEAAAAAQNLVISSLRYFGPEEEVLIQLLRASLGRRTRSFVHRLVDTIVRRCDTEARRRLGQQDSHAGPSPDFQGGPSSPPNASLPTHGEQEEPREDPEGAGPRPSTSSRGSSGCNGRPRRAPKRKAGSPEEPSQPSKKPPHQQ